MHIIALELNGNQLLVAAARLAGKRLQIQSAFGIPIEDINDEVQIGERLSAGLTQHNLKVNYAIVVVPRSEVEIRELSLPPAPDNELPEMVKFMARTEFAALNDNWLLDFVPAGSDPNAPRKVLASGLAPKRHQKISKICETAGIKLKHIVLRPFESLGLLQSSLTDGQGSLIVDLDIDQIDMIISNGKDVVATRTVRVPAGGDRVKGLFLEIKRTIVSADELLKGREVKEVVIIGDTQDDQPLSETIKERLQTNVKLVRPFDLVSLPSNFQVPPEPARYSALIGALVQQSDQTRHAIDFLNPRRPVVRTDARKKAMLYGGLAAAVLLFSLMLGFWMLYSQRQDIAGLTERLQQVVERNEGNDKRPGVDEITSKVRRLDEWMFSDYNWLDEIKLLSQNMKTPDDTITDRFQGQLKSGQPEINLRGRLVKQIERDLVVSLEERYDVRSVFGAPDEDPNYPQPFQFRLLREIDLDQKLEQLDEVADQLIQSRLQTNSEVDSNSQVQ